MCERIASVCVSVVKQDLVLQLVKGVHLDKIQNRAELKMQNRAKLKMF